MAKENKGKAKGVLTPKGQPADRTKAKRKTMVVGKGGVTVLGQYDDKTEKVNKNAN